MIKLIIDQDYKYASWKFRWYKNQLLHNRFGRAAEVYSQRLFYPYYSINYNQITCLYFVSNVRYSYLEHITMREQHMSDLGNEKS